MHFFGVLAAGDVQVAAYVASLGIAQEIGMVRAAIPILRGALEKHLIKKFRLIYNFIDWF
ncbi:hypothetical protein ACU4HD_41410 [Cupriavidus basilensis]